MIRKSHDDIRKRNHETYVEGLSEQAFHEIMEKLRNRDFRKVDGDSNKMRVDIPVLDRLAHDVMSKRMTPETFAEITDRAIQKVNAAIESEGKKLQIPETR